MPHYFFHIRAGDSVDRDEFGIDLPDMKAVRSEARKTIAGFLMDAELGRQSLPGQAFEVSDDRGTCLVIIPFEGLAEEQQRR